MEQVSTRNDRNQRARALKGFLGLRSDGHREESCLYPGRNWKQSWRARLTSMTDLRPTRQLCTRKRHRARLPQPCQHTCRLFCIIDSIILLSHVLMTVMGTTYVCHSHTALVIFRLNPATVGPSAEPSFAIRSLHPRHGTSGTK